MNTSRRGWREGSIEKRGENRWRLRYRINGQGYRVNVSGSITDARRELRRLLKSGDDGQHVAPDKVTLTQWVTDWLALRSGKIAARSHERYEQLLRLHVLPSLGARRLQAISPKDIDTVYATIAAKGLSERTAYYVHVAIGACLKGAVRKGLIQSSPVARADAPAQAGGTTGTALDQEQLTALVSGFRGRVLFPIVAVAAYTGARRGEILALRWSDVDLEAATIRIERAIDDAKAGRTIKLPKSHRGVRTISVDGGLAAVLRAHRECHLRIAAGVPDGVPVDLSLVKLPVDALVFPSPFDFCKLRNPGTVTREFQERAAKLGFPGLRFHDLRGTHETLLLDAGVPIHVVAARCGHDAAVLLRSYAKRTKKADVSASAVIGALSRVALG